MLRTVVVMDRSDRILTAYTIILQVTDSQPHEEAFIIEALRKARDENLARATDLPALKFIIAEP